MWHCQGRKTKREGGIWTVSVGRGRAAAMGSLRQMTPAQKEWKPGRGGKGDELKVQAWGVRSCGQGAD